MFQAISLISSSARGFQTPICPNSAFSLLCTLDVAGRFRHHSSAFSLTHCLFPSPELFLILLDLPHKLLHFLSSHRCMESILKRRMRMKKWRLR
uniref:Uncharacterized protein n=1 Tax=Rhizophora mucronata TaxID=61149 RepID=A0A2P2IIJ6_RHIMU